MGKAGKARGTEARGAVGSGRGDRRNHSGGLAASAWLVGLAAASMIVVAAAACGDGDAEASRAGVSEPREEAGVAVGAGPGDPVAVTDSVLRRLLERLQPPVERSSGLRARRPPRLARADAERLERYLVSNLEEQLPAEKASTITAVYARLGLVPDTLDLRGTLMGLYQEQVVGYYDPASDTLFVLEKVPPAQLEAVVAHELVHALQDQHFDLDSLTRALEGRNDRGTAAQAAIEGHAMLAMVEWQLGQLTGNPVDVTLLPDLGEQLAGMDLTALGEGAGLPALRDAPRVIREALLFPYVGGLTFVQRLWTERPGRPVPFGTELPASSEQVIHPERFLEPGRDHPTDIRFVGGLPGWEEVYADALGELETRIFLEEHLGPGRRAEAAAAGWDGDRFRLLRDGEGREAFLWASVWDSEADADEFAEAARAAYRERYPDAEGAGRRVRVEREEVGGRPAVRVLDAPAALGAEVLTSASEFELE